MESIPKKKAQKHRELIEIAICLLVIITLAIVTAPNIIVEHAMQGQNPLPLVLPIETYAIRDTITATIRIRVLRAWQVSRFQVVPDDCIEKLVINETTIFMKRCDPKEVTKPFDFTLPASNEHDYLIKVQVRNTLAAPMGVSIIPSPNDWWSLMLHTITAALIAFSGYLFTRRKITSDRWILLLLLVGFLVRIIYGMQTPYDVRSYDANAHAQYVKYLSNHFSVPPASGWEFHQPPFYYMLGALMVRIGALIGWPLMAMKSWLQLLSIALSCATLVSGVWIGSLLFRKDQRIHLFLFVSLICSFPGLIMLSSRINNDVLIAFEVFTATGLLLRWWKSGSMKDWYLLWLVASIAFLTKLNGLTILIAIVTLSLLRYNKKTAIRHVTSGLAVFFILTAWLPVVRLHQQSSDIRNLIMTGKAGITPRLKVQHVPADFLTFNPIKMIEIPFNQPFLDTSRRSNSFEYLFRSALFGEFWDFPHTQAAKKVIVFAILLLPWMLYGISKTQLSISRDDLPLIVVFLTTLVLWLAYIIIFQFASEQDFRFSPFFAVASSYFCIRGLQQAPKKWQLFGNCCIACFSVFSLMMLAL